MSHWVNKSGGHEGKQAYDTALSSSAGTPREEQQRLPLQLLEDTTILKKIEIHEATITCKEFAAVAAGHAPLTDASSSHGPSTPAAANSVTNDLLQLLVDEISSMRRTLEAMSQASHFVKV